MRNERQGSGCRAVLLTLGVAWAAIGCEAGGAAHRMLEDMADLEAYMAAPLTDAKITKVLAVVPSLRLCMGTRAAPRPEGREASVELLSLALRLTRCQSVFEHFDTSVAEYLVDAFKIADARERVKARDALEQASAPEGLAVWDAQQARQHAHKAYHLDRAAIARVERRLEAIDAVLQIE